MEITQNNYGYDIAFTVKKTDGTIEDLTGITSVYFQVVDPDTFRNLVNGECTIIDAPNGRCNYTVQQNDFSKAGNFLGSLQLRNATKRVNTKNFYITVNTELGPVA